LIDHYLNSESSALAVAVPPTPLDEEDTVDSYALSATVSISQEISWISF